MVVPVGRITTAQLRAVADLAERYGSGDVRVTTGRNLIVPNIAESRIGALRDEPIFQGAPDFDLEQAVSHPRPRTAAWAG